MYKGASENRQRGIDRIRLADLANGEEYQFEEDKLRNLKSALHNLNERMRGSSGSQRANFVAQKLKWEREVSQLRIKVLGERHKKMGVSQFFVEVAKELLLPAQFKMIMSLAHKKMLEKPSTAE